VAFSITVKTLGFVEDKDNICVCIWYTLYIDCTKSESKK